MSEDIYQGPSLSVISYCGPANTFENTRMRVQIEITNANCGITNLGITDVLALHFALGQWLHAREEERKEDARKTLDEDDDPYEGSFREAADNEGARIAAESSEGNDE